MHACACVCLCVLEAMGGGLRGGGMTGQKEGVKPSERRSLFLFSRCVMICEWLGERHGHGQRERERERDALNVSTVDDIL